MYLAPGIINRCSRANNSKVNNPIWPKFELVRVFYACPHYLQVWQRPNQRWLGKAGDIIFFTAEGQATPKWLVRYYQNSNLSKILCLTSFPVSLMRPEFIATEKRWRHHFPHSKSMRTLKGVYLRSQWSDLAEIRTCPRFYRLSSLHASIKKIR